MRRILNLIRSNNLSMAYMVVHDEAAQVIEVWQCNPENNRENVLCRGFDAAPMRVNIALVQRRAKTLATLLSKMTAREALRQAENIRLHGEVR